MSVYFSYIDAGINHSGCFIYQKYCALFYISAAYLTVPHLTFLVLRGTAKTEAMNEGDSWTMEWTKDTYATCCVKMLKTRISNQHLRFFKLLRILYL